MPDQDCATPDRDGSNPSLLEFIAPGFLHGMGNALFAIQGHCQMLGTDYSHDPSSSRGHILEACQKARAAMTVYRLLADGTDSEPPMAADILIADLATLLRVPLREAGLTLQHEIAPTAVGHKVATAPLVRSVAMAAQGIVLALPTGLEGCLHLRVTVDTDLEIDLCLQTAAGRLPFQVDLGATCRRCTTSLAPAGGRAEIPAAAADLRLTVPIDE